MADTASNTAETRLVGWKRISNYLGCSERTARRWEQDEGLPVRRQMHESKPTVFAHPSDLDGWISSRQAAPPAQTSQPADGAKRFLVIAAAVIATVVWVVFSRSALTDADPGEASVISAEAVDLYERGRSLWLQRGEEPNRRAIALLEQAVEIEPGYAAAWSALASAWITYPTYNLELLPERAHNEAVFAADRALRLDPTLSEPRSIMATIAINRYDWISAEDAYLEAAKADPGNSNMHLWLAGFYRETGRLKKTEEVLAIGRKLDPNSPPIMIETAMNLQVNPDPDLAAQALDHLWSDLGTRFPVVWFGNWNTMLRRGKYDDAVRFVDETPHKDHDELLRAYVQARRSPETTDFNKLTKDIKTAYTNGLDDWLAYSMLDQIKRPAEAMDIVQAVLHDHTTMDATIVMFDPEYPMARQTERFADIVEAFGLVDYWKERGAPDLCETEADFPYCLRIWD